MSSRCPQAIGAGALLPSASFAQGAVANHAGPDTRAVLPVGLTPNLSGDLTMLPGHVARAKVS
jgi:hypothetical protein